MTAFHHSEHDDSISRKPENCVAFYKTSSLTGKPAKELMPLADGKQRPIEQLDETVRE